MKWLSALRFGAPSHGGIVLFAFGFLVCAFGVAIAAAPASPDEWGNLGQVLSPYVIAFGLPPFVVGIAVLRHHRSAQLAGILIGALYGALLLSLGLAGSVEPIILGVLLLLAAVSLVAAYRAHEV